MYYQRKQVVSGAFLVFCIYLILIYSDSGNAAPNPNTNVDSTHRMLHNRPFLRLSDRPAQYGRLKELDDEDLFELSKRQASDDYGHLRFGKRSDEFDDYGHMRFGRNGAD